MGGSRETWPSLIWVQNGHFRSDVIMQWSLILCCSLYLLSCSYRTLFAIHWFYLNLGCPFLAGFSLLCSLILTNYCVANIVHVHWCHSLVGMKYFWFDFLILIQFDTCINTYINRDIHSFTYIHAYIHTYMHDYMIQAGPHYSKDHGQLENGTNR